VSNFPVTHFVREPFASETISELFVVEASFPLVLPWSNIFVLFLYSWHGPI